MVLFKFYLYNLHKSVCSVGTSFLQGLVQHRYYVLYCKLQVKIVQYINAEYITFQQMALECLERMSEYIIGLAIHPISTSSTPIAHGCILPVVAELTVDVVILPVIHRVVGQLGLA